MPTIFATTYDLLLWPAKRRGLRALRRRAVAGLRGRRWCVPVDDGGLVDLLLADGASVAGAF